MNSFYKLIASIIKEAEPFSGHASFRVVDNTAVGTDPIRELSLDAVPLDNDNVMVTLSWEGGIKEFEKTMPSKEAEHMFALISTDLSNIVSLTSEQKFEEAKEAMKNVLKTYAETTDTPVATNVPKLNTTQASGRAHYHTCSQCHTKMGKECGCGYPKVNTDLCEKCSSNRESSLDKNIWKQAKITMQNLFFSTADELAAYQEKMKSLQPSKTDQDSVPLWDKMNNKAPKDTLSAPSMSYEDVEEEKAKEHQNIEKQIDEKIKTELESAMQQKAASVFGPKEDELVKALRGVGRNWDEIKKIFIKDLSYDKDSTTIFLDEQKKKSGEEGVEIGVEEKKPEDALRPPENLVSPETHDKLLKDLEDKKNKPVEEIKEKEIVKEPKFSPKEIMDIPEEEEEKHSSLDNEIARADNDDIRKVASILPKSVVQEVKNMKPNYNAVAGGADFYAFSHDGKQVYRGMWLNRMLADDFHHFQWMYNAKTGEFIEDPNYKPTAYASLKTAADDLNPLQEPIQEAPTMETPKQDVVPMGKQDHQVPSAGDWVMVKSDLKDELPAFKAKFVSEYMSNDGTEYATVETPEQDLLEVERHRVTKITDSKPAAQEADPLATPEIEMQQETPVAVTPPTETLNSTHSSQSELLSIKAEAEQLLKDIQGMGKISFKFIKKGLEKHADDSAFEGNGWCRVWIQEDEIASDSRYPEILKLPDEEAKIAALKDLARDMAHEALRLADSAGAKVGVQSWFDSLNLSDHDRIDWVALANPQVAESSLKQASDFEKGISQDKTADEPTTEPKTQFKELKRAPAYTDKEKAVPASPELDQVLSKLDQLESNLNALDMAKKQIQAKLKEELAKIDQQGERVQLEAEFQDAINKAGVLIDALENKVVSWRDKVYTMQIQEVSYIPNITPKEMLDKIYQRFSEAESFVTSVLNGMKSQAKNVLEKTLIRFPNKKSSLDKNASVIDSWNSELLEALKLLSAPIE